MKAKPYDFCVKIIMEFIQRNNRHQGYFSTLEDQVAPDLSVYTMAKLVNWLIA